MKKNKKFLEKKQLKKKPSKRKKTFQIILTIILILILIPLTYYVTLPKGRIIQGQTYEVSEDAIEFYYDLTYENKNQEITHDHQIFNKVLEIINNSEEFLIVDIFLIGETDRTPYRNLSEEFVTALVNKKQENPEMPIYVISDDFNIILKPHNKKYFNQLKENNIPVIYTPLNRNSPALNPVIRKFIKTSKKSLNHRKLIITKTNNEIISLITSTNFQNHGSENSNTAILIKEKIWKDIYQYEKQEARIEDKKLEEIITNFQEPEKSKSPIKVQYLADGGLMDLLPKEIKNTQKGDEINIAMFTLSDSKTINSLIKASKKGVKINIILDPNKFFFGQNQFGIPNKPVAEKLKRKSDNKINIRWYKSHEEQFHTKLISIKNSTHTTIFQGSSNIASNNIKFYNLQSDVKIITPNNSPINNQINNYFNRLWNNENGTFTQNYSTQKSTSFYKKLKYKFEQFMRKFA
jgi:cardiolipin synthase A/B